MRAMLRQVDVATGEVLDDGVLVYVPHKPRLKGGWFMAMQKGLELLAKQGLSQREFRVLLLLMSRLDFENFIHVSQAFVGKNLQMDRAHVSRAVRRLVELGILIQGPRVGRSGTYRLAPEFGWKGRLRNLDDYRRRGNLEVINGRKGAQEGAGEPVEPVSRR